MSNLFSKRRRRGTTPPKFKAGEIVYSIRGCRIRGIMQLQILNDAQEAPRGRVYWCQIKQAPGVTTLSDPAYHFYESDLTRSFATAEKRTRREIAIEREKINNASNGVIRYAKRLTQMIAAEESLDRIIV